MRLSGGQKKFWTNGWSSGSLKRELSPKPFEEGKKMNEHINGRLIGAIASLTLATTGISWCLWKILPCILRINDGLDFSGLFSGVAVILTATYLMIIEVEKQKKREKGECSH
jgi:hydrogenase-4 membrane subunit HyfE